MHSEGRQAYMQWLHVHTALFIVIGCSMWGVVVCDNDDYEYAEDASPAEQKIDDFPWHETIDEEYSSTDPKANCTSDTAIIDKLLNGTGYNKYRLPG